MGGPTVYQFICNLLPTGLPDLVPVVFVLLTGVGTAL